MSNSEQPPPPNRSRKRCRDISCYSIETGRGLSAKSGGLQLPQAVVLAVGVDSSLFVSKSRRGNLPDVRQLPQDGIREAIIQFRQGNFDLILLGNSIPIERRERLAFLVRASDSQIPVVCVTESSSGHDGFADATIQNEPQYLAQVIGELFANVKRKRMRRCISAKQVDQPPRYLPINGHTFSNGAVAGYFKMLKTEQEIQ